MATHSSFLAWRIPWTEEPGGLWSIGSQRVRHNRATLTSLQVSLTESPVRESVSVQVHTASPRRPLSTQLGSGDPGVHHLSDRSSRVILGVELVCSHLGLPARLLPLEAAQPDSLR